MDTPDSEHPLGKPFIKKLSWVDLGKDIWEEAKDTYVTHICNSCGRDITPMEFTQNNGQCDTCRKNRRKSLAGKSPCFPWERKTGHTEETGQGTILIEIKEGALTIKGNEEKGAPARINLEKKDKRKKNGKKNKKRRMRKT